MKDLCSYQTARPARPRSAPPDYPFTLGRLTNNVALILPPEADQRWSEISPLSASETFTQGRVWRIGTGSPHANDSVKEATVSVRGRGVASSVCTRVIDTSQTLPLALIGCIEPGAVDSCKSNYSHWVEPQTVDFYTADLYLILLSDHNDNFSNYNKKYLQTTTLSFLQK